MCKLPVCFFPSRFPQVPDEKMVPFIWPVTDPRTCILINGLAYRMTSTTKRVGTNWFIRRFFVGRRSTFRESELTWCRLLSPSPRAIHFQPIWQPFTFNERSTCRISSKTLPWRRVHLILKPNSVVQHQTLCSVLKVLRLATRCVFVRLVQTDRQWKQLKVFSSTSQWQTGRRVAQHLETK